jgi:hypothetical protein
LYNGGLIELIHTCRPVTPEYCCQWTLAHELPVSAIPGTDPVATVEAGPFGLAILCVLIIRFPPVYGKGVSSLKTTSCSPVAQILKFPS